MTEDELRDLKDRTAQIIALTEQPGWALLVDRVAVKLHRDQTYLIRGNAKTHEEYLKICAWMDGASYVLNAPTLVESELTTAIQEVQMELEMIESD